MSRAEAILKALREHGPGNVHDLCRRLPEWSRTQVEDAIRNGSRRELIRCRVKGNGRWSPSLWEAVPELMPAPSVFALGARMDWPQGCPPLPAGRRCEPLGSWSAE
jgi:hypothetical protein